MNRYLICLAQIIITATIFIFTPLNQMLYKVLLDKPAAELEETETPDIHNLEERAKHLSKKRDDLVNSSETKFAVIFKRIDEFVLKPLLIRDYEKRYVASSEQVKINSLKKHEEDDFMAGKVKKSFFDPVLFKRVKGNKRHKAKSPRDTAESQLDVPELSNDVETGGSRG